MKNIDIAVNRAVRSFAHAYLRPLTLVSSVAAGVSLAWGSSSAATPTTIALAESALAGGVLALEASCDGGDAVACNDLGVSYLRGYGLPVDLGLALRAFERSCTNGSADGCGNLGALYESGTGVAPNSSAAASLYQQACDLGCALGCSNLGALYARGRGLERDLDAARSLFAVACENGSAAGCGNLLELSSPRR
jgi:TPR repeat protein